MQPSHLNISDFVISFPSLHVRKNLQVQSLIKAAILFIPCSILAGLGGLKGTAGREQKDRERGRGQENRSTERGIVI